MGVLAGNFSDYVPLLTEGNSSSCLSCHLAAKARTSLPQSLCCLQTRCMNVVEGKRPNLDLKHFDTFANRADPDQTALVRAA